MLGRTERGEETDLETESANVLYSSLTIVLLGVTVGHQIPLTSGGHLGSGEHGDHLNPGSEGDRLVVFLHLQPEGGPVPLTGLAA